MSRVCDGKHCRSMIENPFHRSNSLFLLELFGLVFVCAESSLLIAEESFYSTISRSRTEHAPPPRDLAQFYFFSSARKFSPAVLSSLLLCVLSVIISLRYTRRNDTRTQRVVRENCVINLNLAD